MEYTQNSLFGKTSWERLQAMLGVTLKPCLKKSDRPIFQCLIVEDRLEPEWLEVKSAESHGERSMPNFGACPNTVRESSLSQVLESGKATYRYSLTPKACAGILRRAKERGKCLPEMLETVLARQAHNGD